MKSPATTTTTATTISTQEKPTESDEEDVTISVAAARSLCHRAGVQRISGDAIGMVREALADSLGYCPSQGV